MENPITVEATINAPIEKVWQCWNEPEHIKQWAFASDDWEAPHAENNLKVGGKFVTTMSAKDKSFSFDFTGEYTEVKENELIEYNMPKVENEPKARHVKVEFTKVDGGTKVVETFDPESMNTAERQKQGWQAILNNFKKHAESQQ